MANIALIVAAGKGLRFGGDLPKQYLMLAGRSVLQRTVDVFLEHELFDQLLCVIGDDHHDQFHTTVGRLEDGILAERRGYIDDRCISARGVHSLRYRVEDRQAQVLLTALARSYSANDIRAVFDAVMGVELPCFAGDSLADDSRILINKDAHCLLPKIV